MRPSDWIALCGIAATLLVASVSLFFSASMQRRQQQRDDDLHRAQQKREDELRQSHGEDRLRIEFMVDCSVHGRVCEEFLVEFLISANNRGLVAWKFSSIVLRVRGIEEGFPLLPWHPTEPRLGFPVVVVDDAQVIPHTLNFFFVEPGVKQVFSYVTEVPARIRYILSHVEFEYDRFTPHTFERVFRLSSG
jgi:hypothetical protein